MRIQNISRGLCTRGRAALSGNGEITLRDERAALCSATLADRSGKRTHTQCGSILSRSSETPELPSPKFLCVLIKMSDRVGTFDEAKFFGLIGLIGGDERGAKLGVILEGDTWLG